jgi:3'(2'), 5'-bisphosphate nucleotidase
MKYSKNLDLAIYASLIAGEEIMKIYSRDDFEKELKGDGSPLTVADKISHKKIKEILSKSLLPLLSEEGKSIDYETRKNWNRFWMIDPIDGTKEFINRNGEFTVNISLIDNQEPVLGVVYAPYLRDLYFAEKHFGSFKIESIKSYDELSQAKLINLSNSTYPNNFTVVVSKSHMNSETQDYINLIRKNFGNISTSSYGSSLKICKVAEGSAHCYPRFGPTMEWDTAAAHAIAQIAGCKVTQSDGVSKIIYNKENLLNPFFIIQNR